MFRACGIGAALVMTLSGAAFGAVFTFEPAYALALGRTRVGGFFIAYALAAILVRLVFGGVPARVGSYRVACGSLVLYAGVVFALAAAGGTLAAVAILVASPPLRAAGHALRTIR